MSELHIRAATLADAPTLTEFNAAMALETEGRALEAQVLAAGVLALLANATRGVYYVAQRGETVVGQMLITYEWSDWRNGTFWWIQSVYVVPEARGGGVYRALHEWVEGRARATPGICGLRLYVDNENTRAMATYRALGMTETNYKLYETDWSGAPAHGGHGE